MAPNVPFGLTTYTGKHHFGAVGAVANKLTHIIYAVLRDNKPYVPVARPIAS